MPESLKREHRIDSSDSARPAATLEAEPYHYAQGLKPKPRIIKDVAFEELEMTVPRGINPATGKPMAPAKVILKTVTYDDGVTIDTELGEDNDEYQQYLLGQSTKSNGSSKSTRVHRPKAKTRAPKKPAGSKE